MTNSNLLSPWIRRFLLQYLITDRNLARSTQLSYRDTLAALIGYVAKQTGKRADLLELTNFSREHISQFFEHIRQKRACGPRTTNKHLAALHSFAHFVGAYAPEHIEWSGTILGIAFKKFPQPDIPYLEKPEMDALLAAPDRNTSQGERDHTLLLFLYNTGARASEVAQVTVADLQLPAPSDSRSAFVTLHGKGSKTRLCPLWPQTARLLRSAIADHSSQQHVFLNRCGRPFTRFGIHAVVERYARQLATQFSGFSAKRVSPHTLRHTCATHLLQAGVDINTIRAWLGHVSINTTNIYAQINVKMKANALAKLEPAARSSRRKMTSDLMQFLQSL
jgi:site-specific recombinase XerD